MFFTYASVMSAQDQDIFQLGNNLRNQLTETEFKPHHAHVQKTYADVATMTEFYQWVEGPFYDFLYTANSETGYNHTPGFVYFDTRIVGGIRFAQLRVRETPCPATHQFMSAADLKCHGDSSGPFSEESEDTAPFGTGELQFNYAGDGWGEMMIPVVDERARFLSQFRTGEARSYPPPAYPVVFPNNNSTRAWELILALEDQQYIDRATRAVFIDITFYNVSKRVPCCSCCECDCSSCP